MEVKFQKKIKKLFEKRSNLENELNKCHEIILEYIENQSPCSKIDTYFEKCRNYIEQAVEINSELIDMAAKSANSDKLIPAQDMWISFEAVTEPDKLDSSSNVSRHSEKSEKSSRIKQIPALSCLIEAADMEQSESGSQKSSYTAAPSKTLSENKRDLMILKKQQEELERKAKVSLRLKEQQSSLELAELAEEHRKKLAEIELKVLELEDELSEISENAEESGLTRISPN